MEGRRGSTREDFSEKSRQAGALSFVCAREDEISPKQGREDSGAWEATLAPIAGFSAIQLTHCLTSPRAFGPSRLSRTPDGHRASGVNAKRFIPLLWA